MGHNPALRKSNMIGSRDKRPLLWGDFKDLWKPGHERLYLPSHLMKWDSPDAFDVPLHEEMAEYLRKLARAKGKVPAATEQVIHITEPQTESEWHQIVKKAGIEGHRTPHDLRATAITRWDLHCSLSVSYSLEHHSPVGNVRARYTKPTHEDIRRQLARVPRLLPERRAKTALAGK